MNRIVPQFILVALLSAVAPIGLIVAAAVWPAPVTEIPAHWTFAGDPELANSTMVFWMSLIPAAVCFAVAVLGAIFLRADVGRWGTAAGLGIMVLAGAFSVLIWPVGQLTAATTALNNRIGAPFLLYGLALLLGAASFAIAATRAAPGSAIETADKNDR